MARPSGPGAGQAGPPPYRGGLALPHALPALVDRRQLAAETGLGRAAIDGIFRALPVTTVPGVRKVYVRREDVARLLEEHTYTGREVRP